MDEEYLTYEEMMSREEPEQYADYVDICCNWETMDEDEFEEKLDSLDPDLRQLALDDIENQYNDWD